LTPSFHDWSLLWLDLERPSNHWANQGDRTIREVKRRVLPLIVFLYYIAFLDRKNVGFAKLTMQE
jgi:ACS family tartrate transporter-like MFS transporter